VPNFFLEVAPAAHAVVGARLGATAATAPAAKIPPMNPRRVTNDDSTFLLFLTASFLVLSIGIIFEYTFEAR
jgi:hypothetical protein